MAQVHRGHVFHVEGSPSIAESRACLRHIPDGALLIEDGRIQWCGDWAERPPAARTAHVVDHEGAFILPGFIDCHLHFPQASCTDAFGGGGLLPWLENVVFPAEARLSDPHLATAAASFFCDRLVEAGTTTSMVFGSQFPHAQSALFDEAARRGLRMILGRTTMTTGPPAAGPLLTSESDAVAMIRDEIDAFHPRTEDGLRDALQLVAVIPRFALSVTPITLAALGDLYDDVRGKGVYFTSHLSENDAGEDGEVATVRRTFGVDRYLDVYDGRFMPGSARRGSSLIGRRSILAHAVHCNDGELARLAEAGASIAHCPVSQQFLGSGTMPWRRTVSSGVTVAVGSDIAAGDEWFIPRVVNAMFKTHQNAPGGATIHPAELLFTATLAGARALDLEDRIGNFDSGKEADMVVIDPSRDPVLDALVARDHLGEDQDAALLFTLLMAAREPSLTRAYVRGRQLESSRSSGTR